MEAVRIFETLANTTLQSHSQDSVLDTAVRGSVHFISLEDK